MGREFSDSSHRWYVIHTHVRQEDRASSNLRAGNLETFAPKIRERHYNPFTGAPTYFLKPLFPRYIFARFAMDQGLYKVQYTRGVARVVGFGGCPIPVADEVIELMKAQIGAEGYIKPGETFAPGDKVIVREGQLKNFMAVFERDVKESERIRILLTTVNYQGHIEIDRELVQKVS